MNKLYTPATFFTSNLYPKTKNGIPIYFYTRLSDFMKNNYSIFILACLLFFGANVNAQPWTYDFGTGTGTFTSSTASTTFLPTPASGTARVRVGTNPGSFVLANSGLSALGTASELQFTSNTSSTSTTKFSIHDYTAGKTGYVKFNIVIAGGTNGVYKFSLGDGTNYSDNNGIGTAQIFAGIEWTLGASNAITYRVLNNTTYGTTGITGSTTLFTQSTSTVYEVEVYANNTTASTNYFRDGTSYSLANATWDLWVDGTRVGTGLAKGALGTNVNFDSYAFNHQNSATSPGTIYLDDLEYANDLPKIYISDNGTQVAASNVNESTTAHILHKIKIDAVSGLSPNLTGMTCTTAGGYDIADITNLKVRYSTDATLDGADATLSTLTSPGAAGSKTFSTFTSQTITGGTPGYIFITADIAASSASGGNTINVNALTTSNLTFSTGIKTGTTNAGGTQTIISACSAPTTEATAIGFSSVLTTSANVAWTNGGGSSRAVFIKQANTGTPAPVDGTTYTANTTFGSGTQIASSGWYCIYNGTGSSTSVSGLTATTTYRVMVVEYNCAAGSEKYLTSTTSGQNIDNFTTATPSSPTINISASSLTDFGNICVGTNSTSQSYNVSGTSLTNNITVTAPTGFEVKTGAGAWGSSLTLTQSGGTVASTAIDVRFSPSSAGATGTLQVTNASTGATQKDVDVLGTGSNGTPAVTTVTATAITATTASSGGNTISTTCGTITAKGVVWALTANPTIASNLGITSDGTGTANYTSSITGLSSNTLYHYRAYVTNSNGVTTYGSDLTFTTLKAEPTNYPTSFACGSTTTTTIPLIWTDATGAQVPDNYLIKWSSTSYAAITAPSDGTAEANGSTTQNVAQGVGSYTVTGLTSGITYYFKIWSYTNSGSGIDYKLGSEPQTSCATITGPCMGSNFDGSTSVPSGWGGTSSNDAVASHYQSGPNCRALASGVNLITTTVDNPSSISFYVDASGSGGQIGTLEYRIGAGSWTSIGTFTASTAGATETFALTSSPNLTAQTTVSFRITAGSNTIYIDDLEVYCTPACTAPSTSATSLTINNATVNSLDLNFTRGNGDGVLIVAKAGSAPTDPTTGVLYNLSDAVGGGTVVYKGTASGINTATTQTISSLSAETQYYFAIYEYVSATNCYQATAITGNAYTLSTLPTAHAGSFTNTVVAYNQINLSYSTPGSGADGYVILRRADGTNPSTSGIVNGVAPGSWILPSGTVLVNANAIGTSYNNTGLTGSTNYCYILIPFNWNTTNVATYNYRTAATIPSTCGTTPAAPSTSSDIVLSGMVYTSNIDYLSYQAVGPLTNTSGNVGVMGITIRDGGASSPDGDALPTILTGITFTGITGTSMIRTAALFDGNAMVSNSPTISTGANTISFSGLSYSCADNSTRDLTLRVSFLTTVTDNLQMEFNVTNANVTTASGTTSSQMSAFTAVQSSLTSDRNRIEVTATKLNISNISDGVVGVNLTAFSITAADINNNTDLDRNENVVLTTSGSGMSSTSPYTLVSGVVSISNVQYSSIQTSITITGTVSSPSLTGTSNTFNVIVATFVTGDYRTNPAFSGSVFFNSTSPSGGISPWQTWNGSSWVNVTHSTGSPNSPQNLATKPGTIYVGGGAGVTYVDAAGGANYNNIIVEFASSSGYFGSYDNTTGIGILTGKTLEIKKGIFDLGGRIDMQGNSTLVIRDGAEMDISSSSSNFLRNASSTWEVENNAFVFINSYIGYSWTGIEIFHENSYFEITDWDETNDYNLFSTGSITANTYSGFSALFGNLSLNFTTLTSHWNDVLPTGTYNLTHNDFEVTNNDGSGGDNINLIFSGSSDVTIGKDMILYGAEDVQFQVGAGTSSLTIKGNFIKNSSGAFALHPYTANSATLNIEGNMTLNSGTFYITNVSAGAPSAIVNLKGNLKLVSGAYLTNSNSSGYTNDAFNFNGGGPIQTIDVLPHSSNDLMRIRFFVKPNSYVQFINQDVALGTNAGFTVEGDGTLDFGFNGTTALNLVIAGSNTSTYFSSLEKSTLKITNPLGITTTTGAFGNVQVVAGSRSYNQVATFWYIGKANQVTGNGITSGSSAKIIICDLIDNNTQLSFSNSTGITNTTTISSTGGKLDIRRGQVIESTSAYITGSTGTLYMAPGTLYKIMKGYAVATDETGFSGGTFIPRMLGSTYPYILTGGTIELAGDSTTGNGFQTLRGTVGSRPNYKYIKISGNNYYHTPTKTPSNYKNLSSNTTIDSALTITDNAIVDCIGSGGTSQSFVGNGALIMSGNSRIRFKNTSSTQPELDGNALDYALTGGTVEFYGTSAIQQQQLRGNFRTSPSTPVKINYYNIDVNADAANLQTFTSTPNSTQLGSVGNVDVNSSFELTGTINVNSPAVLRMDQTDFIDNGTGTSQVININAGGGLIYANANGIKTSGTGVNDGNIRTSGTRNFSTGANYGFVSSGDMVSGNGLPTTVAGLYAYKTYGVNTVTLNNGGTTVNGILGLQNGKIISSTSNKVILEVVSASSIKSPANVGGVQDMGYDSSYVQGLMGHKSSSTSPMILPIGSPTRYGPIGLTPFNSTIQTYTCDYVSSGLGNYTLDPANSPQLDHVSYLEYWNVTSTASGSNDDAKVKLFWRTYSDVGPSISEWNQLRVAHFDNTDWNTEGNSPAFHASPTTAWGWVESNIYVPNFSPITLGTLTSLNPLPVELTSFTGTCIGNGVSKITWSTASELNSRNFLLQRSSDGSNFTTVAIVNAAGNSNQALNYTVYDSTLITNGNYYRLIEVDTDGKQSIYSFILVECKEVDGMNIYYNQPKVVVEINSNTDRQVSFNVYEVSGKLLHQENKQVVRGYNRFNLNIEKNLAEGIYIIQMVDGKKISSSKLWVH